MKKTGASVAAAVAEPMTGTYGGIDIGALYIDMLCEKFKNRGIKSGLSAEKSAEIRRNARSLGLEVDGVSAKDEKYNTMKIDGRAYMSSDDFAAYYKDLRGYRMPHFYARAEKEYEAAAAVSNVQESGRPPKKAVWLAIRRRIESFAKSFVKEFVVDEVREQIKGEVVLAIPFVGYAVNAIKTPIGTFGLLAGSVFLLERSFHAEKKKDKKELEAIKAEIEKIKQEQSNK